MPPSAATSIPIEIYARALGKFEWTCPNCGQEHPLRKIPWRRADLKCERCYRHYRIGLGFHTSEDAFGHLAGKWRGEAHNKLNPHWNQYDGARVRGTIEWQCPTCNRPQSVFLLDRRVECEYCGKPYWISLLIYASPPAKLGSYRIRTPLDWIIPNVREIVQPIPAETPNPSAGAASGRVREDR